MFHLFGRHSHAHTVATPQPEDKFHVAAYNGDIKASQSMIDACDNESAAASLASKVDAQGNSSLHYAVAQNHEEVAKLILKCGAPVNLKNRDGNTPLHVAARFGFYDVVSMLLDHQADESLKNSRGYTALHTACKGGNMEVVRLLVDAGADILAKGHKGNRPSHVAQSAGHRNVANYLREFERDLLPKSSRNSIFSPGASSVASTIVGEHSHTPDRLRNEITIINNSTDVSNLPALPSSHTSSVQSVSPQRRISFKNSSIDESSKPATVDVTEPVEGESNSAKASTATTESTTKAHVATGPSPIKAAYHAAFTGADVVGRGSRGSALGSIDQASRRSTYLSGADSVTTDSEMEDNNQIVSLEQAKTTIRQLKRELRNLRKQAPIRRVSNAANANIISANRQMSSSSVLTTEDDDPHKYGGVFEFQVAVEAVRQIADDIYGGPRKHSLSRRPNLWGRVVQRRVSIADSLRGCNAEEPRHVDFDSVWALVHLYGLHTRTSKAGLLERLQNMAQK